MKKKPTIWLAVRNSLLLNNTLPVESLAHIIDRATAAGSALLLLSNSKLCSPIGLLVLVEHGYS